MLSDNSEAKTIIQQNRFHHLGIWHVAVLYSHCSHLVVTKCTIIPSSAADPNLLSPPTSTPTSLLLAVGTQPSDHSWWH